MKGRGGRLLEVKKKQGGGRERKGRGESATRSFRRDENRTSDTTDA